MNKAMQYLQTSITPKVQSFSSLGYHFDGADSCITSICDDSRYIQPGDTFLCLPRTGNKTNAYIQTAIEAGAANIIYIGTGKVPSSIPCLLLPDMHATGSFLRRYFGTEKTKTQCIGITGTDGKTSVAWMLREALAKLHQSAWSSGTLGWIKDANHVYDLGNTTPSLLTSHYLLAAADKEKIPTLIMEVSSHGIEQERIAGLTFNAAIWTTLGHDHLDDHGGFDVYSSLKRSFISSVGSHGGSVIYNQDQQVITEKMRAETFVSHPYRRGLSQHAQPQILTWEQELPGLLRLSCQGEEVVIEDIPIGGFHAENVAAVAQLLHTHFHLSLKKISMLLSGITAPPGRMQPVQMGRWQVFIDYAHTPEALQACLDTSRAMTRGRLLLVFGCGGDRDHEKRAQMGNIASNFADIIWITSDNPRYEDAESIAYEIKQGVSTSKAVEIYVQTDREQAIADAIAYMCIDDVLIIAGKGHENYMEVQGNKTPWSDFSCAQQYLDHKNREPKICA